MKKPRFTLIHRSSFILHRSTWLVVLGLASLLCHSYVAHLSREFIPGEGHTERPIWTVLVLLAVAHVFYLLALFVAVRAPPPPPLTKGGRGGVGGTMNDERGGGQGSDSSFIIHRSSFQLDRSLWVILIFAALFRLVHLPGNPIQEIDIYRYLWDGEVTRAGLNPYAYSPSYARYLASVWVTEEGEVLQGGEPASAIGRRYAELLKRPHVGEMFATVEHTEVPTVYPPASQATFALAAVLTPADTSIRGHVIVMKLLFTLFDAGTIVVLIALLRALGKSAHWSIAYAWCPLVIKEIANSGHVDAQAVFFTTLAALLLVKGFRYAGALAWALGILSKVYPLILLPLVVRQLWIGRHRGGWRAVPGPLLLAAGVVGSAYFASWPAFSPKDSPGPPTRGLRVFLTEWEMNDLVFHLLFQAIDQLGDADTKHALVKRFGDLWPRRVTSGVPWWPPPVSPSFVLASGIMGLAVLGVAAWFAMRPASRVASAPGGTDSERWYVTPPPGAHAPGSPEAELFLRGSFATLVTLFLLGPTANPWYLLWAIPFLPWVRLESWFLLPAVVLQYYLWFWFEYQWPASQSIDGQWRVFLPVPGTSFSGREFFNHIWLWVEYVPFYLVLAGEVLYRRRRTRSALPSDPPAA